MKKSIRIVLLSLILSIFSVPVFGAQESLEGVAIRTLDQQSLTNTEQTSSVAIQPRGEIVSEATIEITNKGRGVIGVFATTLCHVEVDRIRTQVILDCYNEDTGMWESIDTYDFDYYAVDYPDELFTDAIISFNITDKQPGYYYRVKGLHAVWKNGSTQGYGTLTDGIMITSY